MSFDPKPIGIGNLATNLKRPQSIPVPVSTLRKVTPEIAENEDSEVAQLAVDVHETNNNLIIVAPLAGVHPDDVRVEITEDVVTIEGERVSPLPEMTDDDFLVQECFFGPFSRSIVLPEAVDSKKARAEFKKSVLVLTIPKLDNVRTRIVKIQPTE